MFTKKSIFRIFSVLLVVVMMLAGFPVEQVVAAPLPEGVNPPLPEQAASVLVGSISAGSAHTCGLKSDGTVACWGSNINGQSAAPAGAFTQVSAGSHHNCGMKSDGTVACWGLNNAGQSTPPAGTFTQVSAGILQTCGVRSDGTVACWGRNVEGQSTPPAGTFTQVNAEGLYFSCGVKSNGTLVCWGEYSPPPAGTFTQISAGVAHACGLKSDGTVACWGSNSYGASAPPAGTFTQISAGGYNTCGVKSDGTLSCWGAGASNTGVFPHHGQSIPPAGVFTQVSAGELNACGLKSDGTVVCWGAGTTNLGVRPNFGQSIAPAGVLFGRTQVSAGGNHTCRLNGNGTLVCWGSNSDGQTTSPGGTFSQISAGGYHTCGLKSDGTLACWGDNSNGMSTPPAGTFTQVSAGLYHTCGMQSNRTPACWGYNAYGQSTPLAGTFTQVSAGSLHTCGLKSDGTLACWGYNYWGQSTPPAGTFTQVSASANHTCGLKSDGTLACWGDNSSGQSTPLAGTFTQVSTGWFHACGLKSDGTVACWGSNSSGQSTPPAGIFTQVSASSYHTCGMKSDGNLVCWGDGYSTIGSVGPGKYDDTNSVFTYTGTWTTSANASVYGGSLHYSSVIGSYGEFAFTGAQFSLIYTAKSNRGTVDVYVDNVNVGTINQYSAATLYQQTWTSAVYPTGFYTVRFVHTGGVYGEIDGITVSNNAASGPGTYDDTNSGFIYSGTWTTSANASAYNGGLHYSSVTGSQAEFTFNGTRFSLIYTAKSNRGTVDVYVDNVNVGTINQYNAATLYQQTWTSSFYSSGAHTVRFVHTGGTYGEIDGITISNNAAPGPGTYDDTDSGFNYSGTWATSANASAYGGGLHYSSVIGSYAEFIFIGTQFSLIYTAKSNRGTVDVYVDNVMVGTINQYDAAILYQQTWTSALYPSAVHTVRFVHASGTYGEIDGITISNSTAPGPGTYDDTNSGFTYAGTWAISANASAYGGGLHYSSVIGSEAQFTFNGTQFSLIYTAKSNRGTVDVYVDNVYVGTINQYDAGILYQQTWTSAVYASGVHTVRFVHTAGTYGEVDGITIMP